MLKRCIRSVHIRVCVFVKYAAYLRNTNLKLLNYAVQVAVIVQASYPVGGEDVIYRHNQKFINAGICLFLLYNFANGGAISQFVQRGGDFPLLVYFRLQVVALYSSPKCTRFLSFVIIPQDMRRNLLQVVRRHYREPYRRLLALDYGPSVVPHFKQPRAIARYV